MAKSYEFWFRRKYNLAPTDPRYLDASFDAIIVDYFAWRAFENPNAVTDETDDDVFEDELTWLEEEDEPIPDDWEAV